MLYISWRSMSLRTIYPCCPDGCMVPTCGRCCFEHDNKEITDASNGQQEVMEVVATVVESP